MPLLPGNHFEDYTVLSLVGHGGSSTVYKVFNPKLDRVEVLKILYSPRADRHLQERFSREFTITHSLNHPNVITVYRHGKAARALPHYPNAELLWMTMQYIQGSTGQALVPNHNQKANLPVILTVLRQVAAGLDYAHAKDVIHRDIKPSNILIENLKDTTTQTIHSVISDFGIASVLDNAQPVSRNGRIYGSIHYTAPEVLQAQQLSPATDQYSLACMLTEFISGKPPFPFETIFAITHAHLCSTPTKLSIKLPWLPHSVDSILAKALSKKPQQRYDSCSEFIEIVAHALQNIEQPEIQHKRHKKLYRYLFWRK